MYYKDFDFVSIEEMCEILEIGRNTAYHLLRSKQIAAFRLGKNWRIPRKSLYDFIEKSIKT